MNRAVRSVILSLLSFSCYALAQNKGSTAKLPPDFYTFKTVYVDQIKLLQDKSGAEVQAAIDTYLNALQNLEKTYQMSGELKPLLSVRKERTRFEANPDLGKIKVAESPAMLGKLQQQLIDACKEIKLSGANGIIELSQHYKRRLTALQKDLTREGRIEEALAVLEKVDQVDTSPEIATAKRQIASGGTEPIVTSGGFAGKRPVDMEALSEFFHGDVRRWNSMTQEVTIRYDFKDEEQLKDWDKATIDPLRSRMVCDHSVVSFLHSFKSVSRIDCESAVYSGTGPIRISLGRGLTVDLEPGADGKALIYQGNPSYPIMKSHGGAQPYLKYLSSITINGGSVKWNMGSRSFPESKLQQPIRPPVSISFGHNDAKTMFGNVTITGVLAPDVINAIQSE